MRKLIALSILVSIAGFLLLGYQIRTYHQTEGSFGTTITTLTKVVALFETSLANGITSSATSMTLVSGTDGDGNALSGKYGFIIDEGSSNEEFVICTASSTALTSCSRGVSVTNPNTTVTALQFSHRRGASVKITNHPQLAQLTRMVNGDDTFPNRLAYSTHPSFSGTAASTSFATKKYVDDTNNTGAADATTTLQGLVEIATQAELVAGTGTGGTGATLVIPGNYFTSSSSAQKVPITNATGYLDSTFINIDSATLEFTGDNKLGVLNVSSSSFSDATDKILRTDGDALPNLWINATYLTTAASRSGDLLVRGATNYGRFASAGADNYSLISSASFTPEMLWAPIIRWHFMTSGTGTSITAPGTAKVAICQIEADNNGGPDLVVKGQVTIFPANLTAATVQEADTGNSPTVTATWSGSTVSITGTNDPTGTCYFFN